MLFAPMICMLKGSKSAFFVTLSMGVNLGPSRTIASYRQGRCNVLI